MSGNPPAKRRAVPSVSTKELLAGFANAVRAERAMAQPVSPACPVPVNPKAPGLPGTFVREARETGLRDYFNALFPPSRNRVRKPDLPAGGVAPDSPGVTTALPSAPRPMLTTRCRETSFETVGALVSAYWAVTPVQRKQAAETLKIDPQGAQFDVRNILTLIDFRKAEPKIVRIQGDGAIKEWRRAITP